MALFSSIIGRSNHVNALMFMGVGDENTTFPTVLSCPLCNKSTLHCYDDTSREDIWFACNTCSGHGNIITFAALIWKVSPAEALARFKEKNLCSYGENAEELDKFAKACERGTVADRFWRSAKAQLWEHDDPNILHKFRDFGVSREIPCDNLIGVAYPEQVGELCKVMTRAFPPNLAKEPTIVLPYHDLPQRISGFLLLQPHEDLSLHRAFIGVSRSSKFKPDAGYYLVDVAQMPAKKAFGNVLFIMDDPLWVLKAQTSQLWYGNELLPICASFHGKEGASYGLILQAFPHSKRFFAGKTITPGLVSEAAGGRGYICIPPGRVHASPTSPTRTVKLLADISRAAITWQTALERVFKTQTNLAAQAFVAELNIPREKLQKFLQTKTTLSDAEVGKLLERVVPHHGMLTYKRCFGDVVERDGCWYTTRGLLITDAIPVISRVIYTNKDEKYYEGYVKKGDATYEFFTSAAAVDKPGLLVYVGKVLADYGELANCLPSWNTKVLPIALAAKPPKVVVASADPGWNEKTREFQFRKYSLTVNGTVVAATCPALCDKNPADFPEPTSVASVDIAPLLTPAHENAALWLLTAAALADMLAPALDADPVGFVLNTTLYQTLAPQAVNIGCEETSVDNFAESSGQPISTTIRQANWPTFIESSNEVDTVLNAQILKSLYRPVFVKVRDAAVFAAASYGWYTFNPDAVLHTLPDASALKFVIPGYIQHVLRDRLVRPPNTPLVLAVLRDLEKWLKTTYGHSFNTAAAENLLVLPTQAHMLFMRDLNNAITIGDIAILPQPRTARQPKDYIIRNKHHWWVGKQIIQDYYKRKTGIAPNWAALLNCFARHGVLISEKEVNREAGCLLQKTWCDDFRLAETQQHDKYVG